MASIRKRKDRDGKFEIAYIDIDGKRYRILISSTDKKIAEKWKRKAEDALAEAQLKNIPIGRIDADFVAGKEKRKRAPTLQEFQADHQTKCELDEKFSKNTYEIYKYSFKSLIKFLGNSKNVYEITPEDIYGWRQNLKKENKKQNTISRYTQHLAAAFRRAQKWQIIEKNPFENIKILSPQKNHKNKTLSLSEIHILESTIKKEQNYKFLDYVMLVASTGCRRSEILNLQYQDLDLDATTPQIMIWSQKTKKKLKLPMSKYLKSYIENEMKPRRNGWKDRGFVFQTQSNTRDVKNKQQPWHPSFVTRKFKYYVRKASLPDHYTLHCLRHTFATFLLRKGEPVETVSKLLGHASIKTTLMVYDHSEALDFKQTVDKYDLSIDEGYSAT